MRKNQIAKKIGIGVVAGTLMIQSFMPLQALATSQQPVAAVTSAEAIKTLTIGQVYEGFKLTKKMASKDLDADVYLFVHEKNGGQVVYIDAPDKNKWFAATFRTPTVDDTGVNHIFEHAVLEGSEKYNVKSPFTEMGKRSVNTYMNALTGTDLTYYPIASENDKDFDNLMRVYLDAVYAPMVLKNDKLLQQEGWRYEFDAKTGKFNFNGVVFNEMKGAMSNYYSVVFNDLKAALYPETKHIYNSGGNPINIVDLTHEALASKHKQYYTASNACLLLYGHMDVTAKLKYINEEYYSKMDKQKEIVDKKVQKPFAKAVRLNKTYPAHSEAKSDTDSILLRSYALNETSAKDRLGLSILSMLLSQGDSSPLYANFVQAGMGASVMADFDTSFYQPSFSFLLEGASNQSMKDFESKLESIMGDLVKKGFDKERVEGIINQYELSFKNALLAADKGDSAIDAVNTGFVTYGDPLMNFNQSELLAEIKKEAAEGKYFENLLQKYFVKNNHQVNIVFEPDAAYMAKMDQALEKKLEDRLAKMTEKEKTALKANIKAYEEWQAKPVDPASLKALPSLSISDLDLTSKTNKTVEAKLGDTRLLKHEVNALGLAETALYFDLKSLTQEELEYMDLFKTILASADTKNYTNEKFVNEIAKYTTGIYTYEICYGDLKDYKNYFPYFVVKSNYSSENASKVTALMLEEMTKAKLDDKTLVKSKLAELVEQIKKEKTNNAHQTVGSKMKATLNGQGVFKDLRLDKGFKRLEAADKDFDKAYPEILKNLNSIYGKLFNPQNMTVSIATDAKGFALNEKAVKDLITGLNKQSFKAQKWDMTPKVQKIGLKIPAEVQYIQLGFNLNALGEKVTGQDLVFAQMLSDGYMYENIRLKGGAYGGALAVGSDGTVRFITYRDPRLKESVEVINGIMNYLKTYKPTQEEINNAIIAVAGKMDQGADLFAQVGEEDAQLLTNYDPAFKEQLKKEILSTKASDLEAFVKKMEKGMKNPSLVIGGSEKQIDANKTLFETIQLIQE